METKPYSLQAPEQIAKEYGGNKQKIAEAMQTGILDPTAGTLAGMFIDRIRAAAQAEQAPQQTVAEQIFAPPAPPAPPAPAPPQGGMPPPPPMGAPPMGPPAGLGATPEAAQMPQMGMPPMDMPPPEQPPMGMAEGGLTTLPLPDAMFDEPNNGGYDDTFANGGIVAFQSAGLVRGIDEEEDEALTGDIVANAGEVDPEQMYGFYRDPELNKTEIIDRIAPRQTKYAEEQNKFLDELRSEKSQKAQAKDDFFSALGSLGAKMASTPGTLFQSFNAGAAEAIPKLAASAKERRAEQVSALKTLATQEGLSNKEALEVANVALGMSGKFGEFRDADLNRKQEAFLTKYRETQANIRNAVSARAGVQSTEISAGASRYGSDQLTKRDVLALRREGYRDFDGTIAQTPVMKNLKQVDPIKFTKLRNQHVEEYVYGPAINLD
jgi:hypothetical protein